MAHQKPQKESLTLTDVLSFIVLAVALFLVVWSPDLTSAELALSPEQRSAAEAWKQAIDEGIVQCDRFATTVDQNKQAVANALPSHFTVSRERISELRKVIDLTHAEVDSVEPFYFPESGLTVPGVRLIIAESDLEVWVFLSEDGTAITGIVGPALPLDGYTEPADVEPKTEVM